MEFYKPMEVPTALYVSENLAPTQKGLSKILQASEAKCLRYVNGCKRYNKERGYTSRMWYFSFGHTIDEYIFMYNCLHCSIVFTKNKGWLVAQAIFCFYEPARKRLPGRPRIRWLERTDRNGWYCLEAEGEDKGFALFATPRQFADALRQFHNLRNIFNQFGQPPMCEASSTGRNTRVLMSLYVFC